MRTENMFHTWKILSHKKEKEHGFLHWNYYNYMYFIICETYTPVVCGGPSIECYPNKNWRLRGSIAATNCLGPCFYPCDRCVGPRRMMKRTCTWIYMGKTIWASLSHGSIVLACVTINFVIKGYSGFVSRLQAISSHRNNTIIIIIIIDWQYNFLIIEYIDYVYTFVGAQTNQNMLLTTENIYILMLIELSFKCVCTVKLGAILTVFGRMKVHDGGGGVMSWITFP